MIDYSNDSDIIELNINKPMTVGEFHLGYLPLLFLLGLSPIVIHPAWFLISFPCGIFVTLYLSKRRKKQNPFEYTKFARTYLSKIPLVTAFLPSVINLPIERKENIREN